MAHKIKATKKEYLERKTIISGLLGDEETTEKICQYASEHWGLSERQTRRYLSDINADFEKYLESNAKRRYARARLRTARLYRKMLKLNQHPCAVALARELNEIDGAKTLKVEHTGKVDSDVTVTNDYSKLSVEELLTLKELIEKAK
jgi:hypothetical protein